MAGAPARRSAKRRLVDAAGLLIAVGLAWWALQRTSFDAIARTFREGELMWVGAALVALCCGHSLRVLRWLSLCGGAGRSRVAAGVAAPIGLLAVTLLPFRLGEGVRLALQRRLDEGARLGSLVGLTVVERAGDLFGILLLIAAGSVGLGEYLLPSLFVGGCVCTAALLGGVSRMDQLALPGPLGRFGPLLGRLAGLLRAQRLGMLARVLLLSGLAWSLDAVCVLLLGRAFAAELPAALATSAAGWVALGVALPTAPAGLGTHQAVMAWRLGDAAAPEVAVAISLGMTALIIVAQALLSAAALLGAAFRRR